MVHQGGDGEMEAGAAKEAFCFLSLNVSSVFG